MEAAKKRTTTELASELPISPGDVIGGKYRVEAVIGSGGMGVVLSARHEAMGQRVAIKVLRLEEDTDRHGAVTRFVREARAAARIESDHVVRVTDVAALRDGTPYMVMEYLEGEDLRALLHRRRQVPIEEAVGYVLQACEGLAEAHAAGVVHRDLKPSNLFVAEKASGKKVLKVLDFGISKVIPRKGEVAITTTNSLMGSPLYMAPEQMRSSKDVDARADVWSLGLILYELLAGIAPFEGDSVPEVCLNVMGGQPLAISRFRADVPNELQAVLLKCMEKERENRHPSMGALARALEPFGAPRERVHAERASAAVKTSRSVMSVETDPEVAPPASVQNDDKLPAAGENQGGILAWRKPDSIPTFAARGERRPRSRKTWLLIGGATCLVAAGLGALMARAPAATAVIPASSAPTATPVARLPDPVATAEIPSVPFDSLPIAARDAGVVGATVFAPHQPHPLPPSARSKGSPSPSASATQKDDWKWGDRN